MTLCFYLCGKHYTARVMRYSGLNAFCESDVSKVKKLVKGKEMSKKLYNGKRVTLSDVARASGFSTSTVSLVLNEAPLSRYVAATTKQKVLEIAKRLKYRPDVNARSLRSRRSHMIGVLVIDLADPFCTFILQGIERKLLPSTYLPILMDVQNQPELLERYIELMVDRHVEGLIVVANWLLFDISSIEDITNLQIPTVIVGRSLESPMCNSVLVDNEAGGYVALKHLYEFGHRDIAFVRGPRSVADSRLRWKGIRRFAKDASLRLDPTLILDLPNIMNSDSAFAGGRRLTKTFIASGKSFTAILAFDDITAYGAIRALSEAGRRVPDDCSVIGFDDIPASALTTPELTTVQQPMCEMGEYAAGYILKQLERLGDGETLTYGDTHLLTPTLLARGSTTRN